MQSRTVRILVLILLAALNIGLLIYYVKSQQEKNNLTPGDVERITAFYEEAGFHMEPDLPLSNPSFKSLSIKNADLDSMAVQYLSGEEYDKTYIYGAKVQYNARDLILVADWQTHTITYQDLALEKLEKERNNEASLFQPTLSELEREILEQVGRSFAVKWLGKSVHLSKWEQKGPLLCLEFHPFEDDMILFFNTVKVEVVKEGIVRASVTAWRIDEDLDAVTVLPLDELLFEQLKEMKEDLQNSTERSEDTVAKILYGYEILEENGEKAVAIPNMTIVLKSGLQYTVRLSGD